MRRALVLAALTVTAVGAAVVGCGSGSNDAASTATVRAIVTGTTVALFHGYATATAATQRTRVAVVRTQVVEQRTRVVLDKTAGPAETAAATTRETEQATAAASVRSTQVAAQRAIASATSAANGAAFAAQVKRMQLAEAACWKGIAGLSVTPGSGSDAAVVTAQSCFQSAIQTMIGGYSPYDDIGARMVSQLVNESASAQSLEQDWGTSMASQDYAAIGSAHSRLLALEQEAHSRGY